MKSYVDANYLKGKILSRLADIGAFGCCGSPADAVEMAFNGVPIVDAVEVVRCRDCKWWSNVGTISKFMSCSNPDGRIASRTECAPDDYCSFGKKRVAKSAHNDRN